MPIPMFNYPDFRPYSNVQPFTVRDGATYLMTLEALREWIRDDLVPHLDKEITELVESWESNVTDIGTQFQEISAALILTAEGLAGESAASAAAAEAAKLAAEAARDLAQQYANDAVEAQDGAIADLLDQETSQTRTKLNTLYVAVATYNALAAVINEGRLSVDTLDDRFDLKVDSTYLSIALETRDAIIDAINDNLDELEELTQSGRLSQTALDIRYVKVKETPHVVVIGSSNATAGNTWVESFLASMGYIGHNFALGGGGFTQTGPTKFSNQVAAAIADTSFDKSAVTHFFICDAGNDIRGTASVFAEAQSVFATITNAYPNAEIVVLPAVWGNATDNNNPGRLQSISKRYQELVNAAVGFRVDIIPETWLWLADNTVWMKPGEVHPNTAGYSRIADFMVKHMRGESTRYDFGHKTIYPDAAVDASQSYWAASRCGNITTLEERFRIANAVNVDIPLGLLDYGTWPINGTYVNVMNVNSRAQDTGRGVVLIGTNGRIQSHTQLAAGTYFIETAYRSF